MSDDWKTKNRTRQILAAAEEGKYGVIAAIAYNLEQILGLVRAAEEARSPLILQFFPWAITFSDGLLVRTGADAARRASVPVAVHLDHAQDEALIRHAADTLPFDSIMVDMSHYEREENLRKTKELVAYCHARQICTEAEPGRIEGGEDGVQDTAGLLASMTTPDEVDAFIATGVDALAPAFGNVHGEYGPAGPTQLDYERLDAIRAQVGGRVRLVLHGTNGFPPDVMRRCIAAGLSKINVNKLSLDDYYEHLQQRVGTAPHTTIIEEGIAKVAAQTVKWMEICGSAGKA
ncbi:hypothetical protein SCUCBS95973_001196 [Sporothrix curviconia]|uniref:Fructose-bisphosphate aldolase n=1 Tax=Sporothrix curviconia TaxID=1260050 RepID=A0ABP0AWM2_9PEZI